LIAIVLAAFNGKTSQQIVEFDLEGYFEQLNLINHLSPSRGNGLKAIVNTIREQAQRSL
jgi:cysteine desulfuration protein SufE